MRKPLGLPVEDALPALLSALDDAGAAVLTAPPGAGKTTLVPLALLDASWATGKVLMLEPRRLAARAAAERMASLLGEKVGAQVGYRIRGEAVTSAQTRIEVVTEGILTRMLQSDPELSGVSAVIFDEFHERSLHADLGLALTLEARSALREDLRLVVMSATLDAGPVAALIGDATIVNSEGRMHPVETRWLDSPRGKVRLEQAVASLISEAHEVETGDILVFLPGVGEIERTRGALRLGDKTDVRILHGGLAFKDQRAALAAPDKGRRKVVLATSIAETSLTVEGVRVVVDAGLSRRARYDPGGAMSRLVTEKASRAEADQRRGRAGRLEPGVCYRLWTKGEEAGMPPFAPPEIAVADLAPLALELANWGADEAELAFLNPPPRVGMEEARALLAALGALDGAGRITGHGRKLAAAPTHPRLAHMILSAPEAQRRIACDVAALLETRDPMRSAGADIAKRLTALRDRSGPPAMRRVAEESARLAKRMRVFGGGRADPGELIARAYPDRIALRRKGGEPRFLLSGGRGAKLAADDALAGHALLAVADVDGEAKEATIRLAAPLSRGQIDDLYGDQMQLIETCHWSRRDRRIEARRQLKLGALALEDKPWKDATGEALAAAMTDGVRDLGLERLPWSKAARLLAARSEWARTRGADLANLSADGLMARLDEWLTPHLLGCRSLDDLAGINLAEVLKAELAWEGTQTLDRLAPAAITAPTGTKLAVDYDGAQPSVAVRLQELFGLDQHPVVGPDRTPLLIELLSPAGRPVQTTADLPGFWRTSYADVRKDMRGRYPRHPWPENPLEAEATRRVKPRGT